MGQQTNAEVFCPMEIATVKLGLTFGLKPKKLLVKVADVAKPEGQIAGLSDGINQPRIQ